jgi:hypothetical protein
MHLIMCLHMHVYECVCMCICEIFFPFVFIIFHVPLFMTNTVYKYTHILVLTSLLKRSFANSKF